MGFKSKRMRKIDDVAKENAQKGKWWKKTEKGYIMRTNDKIYNIFKELATGMKVKSSKLQCLKRMVVERK